MESEISEPSSENQGENILHINKERPVDNCILQIMRDWNNEGLENDILQGNQERPEDYILQNQDKPEEDTGILQINEEMRPENDLQIDHEEDIIQNNQENSTDDIFQVNQERTESPEEGNLQINQEKPEDDILHINQDKPKDDILQSDDERSNNSIGLLQIDDERSNDSIGLLQINQEKPEELVLPINQEKPKDDRDILQINQGRPKENNMVTFYIPVTLVPTIPQISRPINNFGNLPIFVTSLLNQKVPIPRLPQKNTTKCRKKIIANTTLSRKVVENKGKKSHPASKTAIASSPRKSLPKLCPKSQSIRYKHRCQYCDKSYTKLVNLNDHLRALHGIETRYKCQTCNLLFSTSSLKKQHMETVHAPIGQNTFLKPASNIPKQRTNIHESERPVGGIHCEFCDKVFARSGMLNIHLRTVHGVGRQNQKESAIQQDPKVSNLNVRTVETVHVTFVCQQCGQYFMTQATLQKHVEEQHQHVEEQVTVKEHTMHQCDECGKMYFMAWELRAHKRFHSDERPFKCQICNKSFKVTSNLQSHMKNSHGKASTVSRKASSYKVRIQSLLKKTVKDIHGKASTKSRKISNPQVNKVHSILKHTKDIHGKASTISSPQVEVHSILKHTKGIQGSKASTKSKERPDNCQCNVCGKRFKMSDELENHYWEHSEVKPYECNFCDIPFATVVELKNHVRSFHFGDGKNRGAIRID